MSNSIPFVKRGHEFVYIEQLINEWGTRRALYIDAPAGLGKTRLLRELHQHYRSTATHGPLLITDIIDFDDPTLHIPQHVGFQIAHMLNERMFEPYLRVLLDWRKMGMAGVSSERLSQAAFAINQTFVNCFNMVSSQHRVLLMMDTLEALQDTHVLDYMVQVGSQLENSVILIAGRNARQVAEHYHPKSNTNVEVMDLSPLPEHASTSYIRQKHDLLHVAPDPDLVARLVALSNGHPILLDLAATWAARAPLPDWLRSSSLETLHEHRHEFEHAISTHIANTDSLMGEVLMTLAHLAPLDAPLLARIFSLMPAEAEKLLNTARNSMFVRCLPDGRIELHDALCHLINTHVWPAADPNGEKQRSQRRLAAGHLAHQVERMVERMAELDRSRENTQQELHTHTALQQFVEREVLERTLWQIKGQQLSYTLFVDSTVGVTSFANMFDEATSTYRFRFRETLFDHMERSRDHFTPAQWYEVESRRTTCMLDRGTFDAAQELATTMLEQDQLTTEQRINTLLQRANASARLGHFAEAIHDCEAAIEMSRTANHQPCLIRALNARGWIARNQGQHNNALENYLEAYQVSLQINDLQQTAWILNNIAFVNTLKGNRQAAFESSRAALDICQTQGFLRCMGAVYSNLGGIYVRFDQAPEALKHYTRALDIFSAEDDRDWMSLVHCGRSYAFLSRGELEKADEALTWAWDNGAVYLKPRILYARALTAWARNDLDGARQHLEACRAMSQQLGDRFHDYKSFADLTELAWEFHEYHRWQEFADQLNQLYTTQRASEDLLRLRGSCLRKIGDMAICTDSYADALAAYKEGLCLIAEHEVHEPYILRSQIRQTDRRIRERITGETMSQLGHDLMQFWRASKTLMEQYPDALLIFHRWERGETTI